MFQEIYPADVKKLRAQSADSGTGGGARDFRFPAAGFGEVFRRLFPDTKKVKRRRKKKTIELEVNTGTIHWTERSPEDEIVLRSAEVFYEPPTTSRPTEDRITKVHEVPPLDPSHIPPSSEGTTFVLFIQDAKDMVWAYYTSEQQLMKAGWEPAVSRPILDCLLHPDRKGMKRPPRVQGYIDLSTKRSYCHAF